MMSSLPEWHYIGLIALILLFSFTLSSAAGFGSSVIAIPLCATFMDMRMAIPLLSLSSAITGVAMSINEHRHVDKKQLRWMLGLMMLGFPLGNLGFHLLPLALLRLMLGIFVTGVAVHGFWRLHRRAPRQPWRPLPGAVLLFCAGLVQGATATGGPLTVTYAQQAIADKSRFRATLFVLWIFFNTMFMISYFAGPTSSSSVAVLALLCLPALFIGMWLGQKLHARASDMVFQVLVCSILLVSGISLLMR